VHLTSVTLRNFKRFRDFEARFGPGINVVKGPMNEMGKSTLLEGIVAGLFHNPKATGRKLGEYVSWGAERRHETRLEFEDAGARYMLEKDFDRGTAKLLAVDSGEELDTFRRIAGRVAEIVGTGSESLFSLTCCIRQDEVRQVASGKKEIADGIEAVVTGGAEDVRASKVVQELEARISGLKRGLDRPAKNKGTLAVVKEEIDSLEARRRETSVELAKSEADKARLVELVREIDELKLEQENADVLLEKNRKLRDVEGEVEGLKQRYAELDTLHRQASSLMKRLAEINEALSSIEGLETHGRVQELRKGLDEVNTREETIVGETVGARGELAAVEAAIVQLRARLEHAGAALASMEGFKSRRETSAAGASLRAIEARRETIEKDLVERDAELLSAVEVLERRRAQRILGSKAHFAVAALLCVVGVGAAIAGLLSLIGLAVAGSVLLGLAIRARSFVVRQRSEVSHLEKRVNDMKEALCALDGERDEVVSRFGCASVQEFNEKERHSQAVVKEQQGLEGQLAVQEEKRSEVGRRLSAWQRSVEELGIRRAELLAGAKCGDEEEFRAKEHSFGDLVAERDGIENQLKGMLGDSAISDVEQSRSEVVRDLRVAEDRLTEDLAQCRLSQEDYVELKSRLGRLGERLSELDDERRNCEARVRFAKYDAEDEARLEEDLEFARRRLARGERKLQAYELALEFLVKARGDLLVSVNEALARGIERYFNIFSNGKYTCVGVGEDGLEFRVYSDEKGDWARPEELSGGAIDEFYLACRLALAQLLFGDARPPLVLDDVLVNFDAVRLGRALEVFRMLAPEYQVIIFTLSDVYDRIADNVVVLNEKERLL